MSSMVTHLPIIKVIKLVILIVFGIINFIFVSCRKLLTNYFRYLIDRNKFATMFLITVKLEHFML